MNIYYNGQQLIDKGRELGAPFLCAIGGKGNGKTYSFCKYGIEQWSKTGAKFVYLRRMKTMIDKKNIQTLLDPHTKLLKELTKNKYNEFNYFSGGIDAVYRNRQGKIERRSTVCVFRALATLESQTGADLGKISIIIYDEVISRERSLSDEFNKTMIAHNNFTRNRTDEYVPFVLVGNTLSRSNELLEQFGIDCRKLKQGEITATYSTKGEIRLLLEYCAQLDIQKTADETFYARFENERINMITKGTWTISEYKPPFFDYVNKTPINSINFVHNNMCVVIDMYLIYNEMVAFVRYRNKDDEKKTFELWISDTMKHSKNKIICRALFTERFANLIRCFATKQFYTNDNFAVEDLRDILKDIVNGEYIRKYLE